MIVDRVPLALLEVVDQLAGLDRRRRDAPIAVTVLIIGFVAIAILVPVSVLVGAGRTERVHTACERRGTDA